MIYLQKYQYVLTETNKYKRDNIILIGFMGSGKTTIGKMLAKNLKMDFVDTDLEIEKKEETTIKTIFETKGESYFRNLENDLLKSYSRNKNLIIATGGGMACHPGNIKLINKLGISFFLKVGFDELYNRLSKDTKRPLLKQHDKLSLKALLRHRTQFYSSADFCVIASRSVENICNRIIHLYQKSK